MRRRPMSEPATVSSSCGGPWVKVRPAGGSSRHLRPHGNCDSLHHSELPGERAEALFIAKAVLVPTAGEHSEI